MVWNLEKPNFLLLVLGTGYVCRFCFKTTGNWLKTLKFVTSEMWKPWYLTLFVESFVQAAHLSVRSNSLLPAIFYHILTVVSSIHAMIIKIAITSAQSTWKTLVGSFQVGGNIFWTRLHFCLRQIDNTDSTWWPARAMRIHVAHDVNCAST